MSRRDEPSGIGLTTVGVQPATIMLITMLISEQADQDVIITVIVHYVQGNQSLWELCTGVER